MAIFPNLFTDPTVQVADRIRLDANQSFVSGEATSISLVRIKPSASDAFIDVTGNRYLDWAYSTDGDKTVTVEVTTDGSPVTKDFTVSVVTEESDKLFSFDADLIAYESEIHRYLPAGRSSFKYVHRSAQDRILKYLDEHRVWDKDGNRLTKAAITDIEEVRDWSKFMVLMLINENNSNQVDDLFSEKAALYKSMMVAARNRAALRLDRDGDGSTDEDIKDMRAFVLRRV